MVKVLTTTGIEVSHSVLTRREWLGKTSKALGALATIGISGIISAKNLTREEGARTILLLDQKIKDLKKDDKEKEVVQLLETFKEHFRECGVVSRDLPVLAATLYNYHEEDSKIILDEMSPALHPELINAHWEKRNIPYLVDSFASICLKEAVYFGENPELVIEKIKSHNEFAKKLDSLPNKNPTKEAFTNLSRNSETLESAKHYLAKFVYWEYMGYKAQLEFLYRCGWNANARAKMRKDNVIGQNSFLKMSFISNLERMGFVSQNGKLDTNNFARTIVRNMLHASTRIAKANEGLSDDTLKSAFNIVFATHPEYNSTENLLELFERTNLFDFVTDKKYWRTVS